MVEKVSREQNNNITRFQVSETLCLAINNIDYVLKYIQPFVQVRLLFQYGLSPLSDNLFFVLKIHF